MAKEKQGEKQGVKGKIDGFLADRAAQVAEAALSGMDLEGMAKDFYEAVRFHLAQEKRMADALERIANSLEVMRGR